jgi:hypothetical protein
LGIAHRKGIEALLCAGSAAGLFAFLLHTEEAMLPVPPTGTEPDTPLPDPQPSPQGVAERGLRGSRYSALKHVSCDYHDGVLVLRGCLPTYYLKQIAQEVVAHQLDHGERLENRIEVVRPVPR